MDLHVTIMPVVTKDLHVITILPEVTKDLSISSRFVSCDFLKMRCKFSTLTTRQLMAEFYLLRGNDR